MYKGRQDWSVALWRAANAVSHDLVEGGGAREEELVVKASGSVFEDPKSCFDE
jgi:hypothetical protein